MRIAIALGMTVLMVAELSLGADHLVLAERRIGVGFRLGSFGWMSFVAFSPDGTMVASDGPTSPNDTSGGLTLWSFPDGAFIRRLPGQPEAISPDWKYYATYHGISRMEDGRPVILPGDKEYTGHAFSPDSRYVAETSPLRASKIRVLELASGKQISAFGRHEPSSLAVSPDGVTMAAGYCGGRVRDRNSVIPFVAHYVYTYRISAPIRLTGTQGCGRRSRERTQSARA